MVANKDNNAIVIKKYANRRLYNTGTSSYVTLDDLAVMVKEGVEFVVVDAKTGDDITRSVLTQIIVEEESKGGQTMLPISFLRQLIAFYGHGMQSLVPQYLESTMEAFAASQDKWRDYMSGKSVPTPTFGAFDEMARKNMEMFEQATRMFTGGKTPSQQQPKSEESVSKAELDQLKDQLAALKDQLDKLAK